MDSLLINTCQSVEAAVPVIRSAVALLVALGIFTVLLLAYMAGSLREIEKKFHGK